MSVMDLAQELIRTNWHKSNDSWAYHDYGIVRMVARLTGLSEREVAIQLHVVATIELIIGDVLE